MRITYIYLQAILAHINHLNLALPQTIVALTFAHYAAKPFFEDCDPPQNSVKLLAACCLCK